MKAYVFTDKSLERYAGQFVWLAIDTENGRNTKFLAKYPIQVWPTLMVIDPKKETVALKYAGGATVPQLRKLLEDDSIPLSGDDKSGLYESLISARDDMKDEAGAHKLREEWAAFLEGEAAKAKTAEQRAVYDSHRLAAYLDLKTPEKAIPMLEQSERDFPK